MKTLIELFDECQLENVIAGLKFRPEKIVFVGYKNIMTSGRKAALEGLFKNRGYNISFRYEIVGRYDFESICKKLISIYEENEDCCFDLTGGKELVLAAMGTLAERLHIPMIQFDIKSGNLIRVLSTNEVPEPGVVTMSFKELVSLQGGSIVENADSEFEWNLTKEFKDDIRKMWSVCRADCPKWNRQTNILGSFEEKDRLYGDLAVDVEFPSVKGAATTVPDRDFMDMLLNHGLIKNYEINSRGLKFSYKSESVRRALIKAGNALELYGYMLCREIALEDEGFYDDIHSGVMVDWDPAGAPDRAFGTDTQNELDIVMMRDIVPVFVSCKNGEVHKEALYELDTVSKKFGGKYAKKVLLCTHIAFNEKSRKHIEARAKDMNVELISDIHKMSEEELKNILRTKAR